MALSYQVKLAITIAIFTLLIGALIIEREVRWFEGRYSPNDITERDLTELQGDIAVDSEERGGVEVPGREDVNCGGEVCHRDEWINWPYSGVVALPNSDLHWERMKSFIPEGCIRTTCEGISPNRTYCEPGETELITYVYREPTKHKRTGESAWVFNFHILGRDIPLPNPDGSISAVPWHSKQGRGSVCEGITDPEANLFRSYPELADHESKAQMEQLCFCCEGCTSTETHPY